MNKNNGVSRFAERAGWCVTIVTFFGGTTFLHFQQEANHQNQISLLQKHSQSSNVTKPVEHTNVTKPVEYAKRTSPVEVASKILPPLDSDIGHAFWVLDQLDVMKTEVTKELYSYVMFGVAAENTPMIFFNLDDVFHFANRLSVHQGLQPCYRNDSLREECSGWRIPTDNEWMLFASAGQGTKYAGSDVFDDVGWDRNRSYRVASKPPNSWGMYDMSGGARELVLDHKESSYGLLGDERPLNHMRVQELGDSFAVRFVRNAPIESQRF